MPQVREAGGLDQGGGGRGAEKLSGRAERMNELAGWMWGEAEESKMMPRFWLTSDGAPSTKEASLSPSDPKRTLLYVLITPCVPPLGNQPFVIQTPIVFSVSAAHLNQHDTKQGLCPPQSRARCRHTIHIC